MQCLLKEAKYQSHVRVRVRFRSGSCPVPVGVVSGFVSGSCPGSCPGPVRVWLVFGSCPVRVRVRVWVSVWVHVWFAIRVRVFLSGSCPGSCPFRVWLVSGCVLGSCLARVRFVFGSCPLRVSFVFGLMSGFVFGFVSGFASGFAFVSCPVSVRFVMGSCLVSYSNSCLVRNWVRTRIRVLFRIWIRISKISTKSSLILNVICA